MIARIWTGATRTADADALYRFRTCRGFCELVFGPMSLLRQDRGLCPFACSI